MSKPLHIFYIIISLLSALPLYEIQADNEIVVDRNYQKNKAKADSLYNIEEYDSAASLYNYILSHQGKSPELYYNLGNCYYRKDSMALAILNYERALKLDPSDSDTRKNLSIAKSKIKDRSTETSEFFLFAWWYSLVNKFSPTFWKFLGIVFFGITLLSILLYSLSNKDRVKRCLKALIITSLALCLISNYSAWHQYRSEISVQSAIVISAKTSVKSSPSSSSTDLFVLHSGSRVTIIDNSIKEWYEIRYEEGKKGWINVNDITII